jgi:hypothetical protein
MRRILYNKAYPIAVSEQPIQILSVNDKWSQTVMVADSGLPNSAQIFSFELYIPVCSVHVKHGFLNYVLLQGK